MTDAERAKAKIGEEQKPEKWLKANNREKAVKDAVAKALITFCEQSGTFAAAVADGKPLIECCREIVKGNEQYLSDLEVYQRAVRFYMPGADIEWSMTVRPAAGKEDTPTFNVSFLTLLGGGKDAGV